MLSNGIQANTEFGILYGTYELLRRLYFQKFSKKPIPADCKQPVGKLDDIIANDLKRKMPWVRG
ncbi:hypothetical protein FFL01_12510 [Flavobacterium flevense]|uniref:Uncharacterized protein n=1 Tax=Flavobacterium flevense TaxID=983 RepID=A0A4Y4AX50_9FLAO|nr:hypothetical protein FFL01_12510 [Flavobacterium flevense]